MSITVTRRSFDFSQSPKYYFDNNQITTHFFNALSGTFPAGEQFFVDSVRQFRDVLPKLHPFQKDVSGFIGQEAMHTLAHHAFNTFSKTHNVPIDKIELSTEHLLALTKKILTPRQQLAATVCLEHYTALMGGKLLEDDFFNSKLQGELKELWMWHAKEEVAHAHVAWDLYHLDEVGGNYAERCVIMLLASVVFLAAIATMTTVLVKREGLRKVDLFKGVGYIIGRKGFLTQLIPAYLLFFKPGFHPNDHTRGVLNAVENTHKDFCPSVS